MSEETGDKMTWKDLGLSDALCAACDRLKWTHPSEIQREAIPLALQGKDIIGLAETGSGKTAAFALPILEALLEKPQRYSALVLTPTRELALQILEQFNLLGADIGLKCVALVGGVNIDSQSAALSRKPHVVVATPGRLLDHLDNTKNFHLKKLKFLVMDEADRMLNMNFEKEIQRIIEEIPRERTTFLFSATMTEKVSDLERACLRDPVKIKVSNINQTVQKLQQYYIFIPFDYRYMYLVNVLQKLSGSVFMIFCNTWINTARTTYLLRKLNFTVTQLHGKMSQKQRLEALEKFKNKERSILVATDVANRGLDIPRVDVVINFDFMDGSREYIHRVGRTARAGKAGTAITFVTQYDIKWYLYLERFLGRKLPQFETNEPEVLALKEKVSKAETFAKEQLKEFIDKRKRKRKGEDEEEDGEEDNEDGQKKDSNDKGAKHKNKKRRWKK